MSLNHSWFGPKTIPAPRDYGAENKVTVAPSKLGRLTTADEPLRGAMNDVPVALAPAGVDALQAAAQCGDPPIRGSARGAISMVKRGPELRAPRCE
jgi:hypothetical protein